MSDLIIKPSGTSANFKVQNPSGTDKIVMNSSGTITTGTLGSGVTFPADHIIQVQSTTKTDTTSRHNDNTTSPPDYADIIGMSVSITPKTGSKILVFAMLSLSVNQNFNLTYRLVRDSTPICIGDSSSDRARATGALRGFSGYEVEAFPISFLDTSPGGDGSTSITYKFQWDGENGGTMYLNMSQQNNDRYDFARSVSTITVMEIAG